MEIYVGNLPYETDDEALREIFGEYGTVDNVKIIINHDTGRSKGYAFVTMNDNEEAEKAIEALDGNDIGGRPIKVNESRPREQRGYGNSNNNSNSNRNFRKKRY